ncbi:MAG: GNAT family N-acetyltransferase [Oscillospiraceae bacterium]|nr:GNAT family N-acetyltransferase [Oscillospiraceae bacterium]
MESAKDQNKTPYLTIRPLADSEINAALKLAWDIFLKFEAPDYPLEGVEEFRLTLKNEEYLSGLKYYGAFDGEKLVGILAIREAAAHICFFFVDSQYQRKGIGTKLFSRMMEDFSERIVTLNSAPYGKPFYKKLGFVETDCEQSVNGITFTPMVYRQDT